MRKLALLCIVCVGCAGGQVKQAAVADRSDSVLGCWSLAAVDFKNALLPTGTTVRLDSVASAYQPGFQQLVRVSTPPARVVEERNYWHINSGDRHIMMTLSDGTNSVTMDFVPAPERMYGRAGTGAAVTAKRAKCPQ